jgi:dienelactone hydrolase
MMLQAMRMLSAFLISVALHAADVRPIPPPGVEVPANTRTQLDEGLKRLSASIDQLRGVKLLPDVVIFRDAVRYALEHNEFFKPEEIAGARELLRVGQQRADDLTQGRAPWTTATGLVVRGYVSKIDGSVQPYGLVIPTTFSPDRKWRLDTWFHGRGETLSEVNFLLDRMRNPGEFTPANAIVVHLYGRYCNANKFAGEVDLFETLEVVKKQYPIDENRIVIRGFSMGGAAAWHFAAHHAGMWAAAAPGAGFSESADFLKVYQRETIKPTWWEEKLYHMYDATDYAANLYNCPTVAYSGETDGQIQAARMMEKALAGEGMSLKHVIGPGTPHRYHPDSKVEINRILDALSEKGREQYPRKIRFTTFTLAYNEMKWVTVDALDQHWERARLDAELSNDATIQVKSSNVNAFTLNFGPAGFPFAADVKPTVVINGQRVAAPSGPATDGSWKVSFHRLGEKWAAGAVSASGQKRHGLQGPVDDAFMDSFIFVKPTGTPAAPGVAKWVESEQARAIREWRRQFRGDAQVRDDNTITDAEIANSNLVLWGDPGSNKILARIADKLPIRWTGSELVANGAKYPAATHAPILIYPNPLNPSRYMVLNSGFTFREYDYLNNARQISKLPDWAVVDTTVPPDERFPGKIAAAGFFNEKWEWKPVAAPAVRKAD